MPYCCVPGCGNKSSDPRCATLTFHRLPLNKKRILDCWLERLNLAEQLHIPDHFLVCSEHFDERCFRQSAWASKRYVLPGSIPNKFENLASNSIHRLNKANQRRPNKECAITFSDKNKATISLSSSFESSHSRHSQIDCLIDSSESQEFNQIQNENIIKNNNDNETNSKIICLRTANSSTLCVIQERCTEATSLELEHSGVLRTSNSENCQGNVAFCFIKQKRRKKTY
jgi:hypothetical protein